MKIYPTSNHGTDILTSDSRAMDFVVGWIFGRAEILSKPPEQTKP